MRRWWLLAAIFLAASVRCTAQVPHGKHTVTVTFDYDFRLTPACSAKVTQKCVQRFVVYDISGGPSKRIRPFFVAVPDGASGPVNGIGGRSPELDFESGKHLLAVTAQNPEGVESDPSDATIWITIP